jgi:hypothetical protein
MDVRSGAHAVVGAVNARRVAEAGSRPHELVGVTGEATAEAGRAPGRRSTGAVTHVVHVASAPPVTPDAAATRLQAAYRAHSARRAVRTRRAVAAVEATPPVAPRELSPRSDAAAVRLQSAYRAHSARRAARARRAQQSAATGAARATAQATVGGAAAEAAAAATRVQAAFRAHVGRRAAQVGRRQRPSSGGGGGGDAAPAALVSFGHRPRMAGRAPWWDDGLSSASDGGGRAPAPSLGSQAAVLGLATLEDLDVQLGGDADVSEGEHARDVGAREGVASGAHAGAAAVEEPDATAEAVFGGAVVTAGAPASADVVARRAASPSRRSPASASPPSHGSPAGGESRHWWQRRGKGTAASPAGE